MFSIIKLLSKKKFFFRVPYKVDIIFFYKLNSNFIFDKNIKHFELYDQLYILEFLKALIECTLRFNLDIKKQYFKIVLNNFDPKIAVGDEINKNIFKFKKVFPKKISIGFQIVNWSSLNSDKRHFPYKNECDYFLVYNNFFKKFYKNKFINTKFIVSGSIRNNQILIKNKKKKKYDILFISEYRDQVYENIPPNRATKAIKKNFFRNKSLILKAVNQIVLEKKLKLCVALSSNREEKKKTISKVGEINFYKNRLNKFTIENKNSYNLAANSNIIISMWSTLGTELFSQKKKVLFLAPVFAKKLYWNFLPSKIGYNWYQGHKLNLIKNKISQFLKQNNSTWEVYCQKCNYGIHFDKNNKILKNLIKKNLNDTKK